MVLVLGTVAWLCCTSQGNAVPHTHCAQAAVSHEAMSNLGTTRHHLCRQREDLKLEKFLPSAWIKILIQWLNTLTRLQNINHAADKKEYGTFFSRFHFLRGML